MRITITCPTCNKRSQIDDSLRGKRLRCPYQDCRKPFRLSETGEAMSLEPPAIVEQPKVVEWQAPIPPRASAGPGGWDSPAVADWQAAPPPQRGTEESDSPSQPAGYEGSWQAPAEAPAEYAEAEGSYYGESEEAVDYYAPVKKKKHGKVLLIFILIGIVGLAAGGLGWLQIAKAAEGKALREAMKDYADHRYSAAESKFKQLTERFPDSQDISTYRFMERLAGMRAAVTETGMDVAKSEDIYRKFYNEYRGKPLYKEYIDDIWQGSVDFVNAGYARAQEKAERAALDKVLDAFNVVVKDIGENLRDPTVAHKLYPDMESRYKKANEAVAQTEARKILWEALGKLIDSKRPGDVEEAQQLFDDAARRYPNLLKDREIQTRLTNLKTSEPSLIKYTKHDQKLPKPVAGGADGRSLAVGPLVQGHPTAVSANDPVILSLARGILYAQKLSTGELLWSMRVGVDTHTLPERMPARPPQPEIALVLSTEAAADKAVVTAIDVRTGEARWSYPLNSACPAGPILASRIAYFPTADGKVHEIEAVEGRLMGVFEVGQPLTVPGGFDPVARRLFIPADRKRIYVLDVASKSCAGVYYTNHSVGGLRAAPVVTPSKPGEPSTLIIAEGSSQLSMVIKSFAISDTGDTFTESPQKYRINGWAWFSPFFDGDTLGYVTDRGSLALFGVKRGTSDQSVIMLSAPPKKAGDLYGLPVGELKGLEASNQPPIGPAQIAYVNLNEWWLLMAGKLYRYRYDLYRQQLVQAAGSGLPLGAPLQPSQARGQYLVLGTQTLDRAVVTALDRRSGSVVWQRQLGLMTAKEPLVLGQHLLALDRTGGLFHLDAGKLPAAASDSARIPGPSAGDWLANGLPTADPGSPPLLVASPDGKFAIAALHDPAVDKITLRRYEPGKGIVSEVTSRFESAPQINGTPALSSESLIIPCRDGNLRELPLTGAKELPVAMAWRNRDAPAGAIGHAVFLSDTQLVATDGFRKLLRWERGMMGDRRWRKIPGGDQEPNEHRITTPLIVVGGPQGEKLLGFGDSGGGVHLWSVTRSESVRSWRFENQLITKGPFLRDGHLGVVLNHTELVWLDPAKNTPMWQTSYPAGIAGEPQRVGSYVLVAENTGTYHWLDLAGNEKGKERIKSRVVPATAAVPLGPTTAFAPLSDGTVLILSVPSPAAARAD